MGQKIAILVLILLIACCCCIPIFTRLNNDWKLHNYETQFLQISHPSSTSLIALETGVFGVNANDCGYFVGEIRQYLGTRDEIEQFYAAQAATDEHFFRHTNLIFIEEGNFSTSGLLPYDLESVSDWKIATSDLEGDLYLYYFLYDEYTPFDWRCK